LFCLAKDPGIITKHPPSGNPQKNPQQSIKTYKGKITYYFS